MRRGLRRTAWQRPRHGGESDPERLDAELCRRVDASFRRAAELAGEKLACRPGCADCCHEPFPINALDVARLRRGLAYLSESDPARAARIEKRAEKTRERLEQGFPGDFESGRLKEETELLDPFLARHAGLPCPVLDPDSGRCELYDFRPIPCRSYGPPLDYGTEKAPPCSLCFVGEPRSEIDRCRVAPDPDDLENAAIRAAVAPEDERYETLIACALVVFWPSRRAGG